MKFKPSNFNFGTLIHRFPLWKYPKPGDTNVPGPSSPEGGVAGGVISDPKFGTSHKRHSSRYVLPANTPVQVYFNSPQTVRVSIRNVGNNSAVFDTTSAVFINPATGQAHYGNALQGAVGTEPTAGESDVFDNDNDIWAFSVTGTIIIVDEETK